MAWWEKPSASSILHLLFFLYDACKYQLCMNDDGEWSKKTRENSFMFVLSFFPDDHDHDHDDGACVWSVEMIIFRQCIYFLHALIIHKSVGLHRNFLYTVIIVQHGKSLNHWWWHRVRVILIMMTLLSDWIRKTKKL